MPRIARQKFEGAPTDADVRERDDFSAEVLERSRWFSSDEGRREMADKRYRSISVASAMVEDVLDLAGEVGMSPLQVVERALLGYSATLGFEVPEIEEVRAHIASVLDRADASAA